MGVPRFADAGHQPAKIVAIGLDANLLADPPVVKVSSPKVGGVDVMTVYGRAAGVLEDLEVAPATALGLTARPTGGSPGGGHLPPARAWRRTRRQGLSASIPPSTPSATPEP